MEDIEWLEGNESEPEKWFEGSTKVSWLDSSNQVQEEDEEVQWLESTKEDKNEEVEWLGSTKKASTNSEEEKGETTNGWFLASKELEVGGGTVESHMGPQWFEASVEDLGQLEIFDLPPALNVHVEVTGELACVYICICICILYLYLYFVFVFVF